MNENLSIIVTPKPGEITANFDDIKQELENMMTAYEGLEVTEESAKERKEDCAALRKMVKAIEDKRKEVKKTYTEPLDDFEAKCKELTGVINEKITTIDSGLKVLEQKRIAEKKKHIEEIYKGAVGEYAEFLPLDKIYNARWDNKTCSDNEITSDIQQMVLQVKLDLQAIKGLQSRYENQLIGAYKIGGITCAMAKHADFTEAEKAMERERHEQELEKARREAEAKKTEQPEEKPPETKQIQPESFGMNSPVWMIEITGEENIKQAKELLEFSEIPFKEVRA